MRVVVLGPANGLVDRVDEVAVDAHDNGFVLLVADDDALESNTLRHLSPLLESLVGALRGDGLDARDVAAGLTQARVFRCPVAALETQVEAPFRLRTASSI